MDGGMNVDGSLYLRKSRNSRGVMPWKEPLNLPEKDKFYIWNSNKNNCLTFLLFLYCCWGKGSLEHITTGRVSVGTCLLKDKLFSKLIVMTSVKRGLRIENTTNKD